MSDIYTDDQPLDDDRTDELPVLLETVATGAEDPHPRMESLDETAEHTAHYAGLSADATEVDGLRRDLAARAEKIAALETDIDRLSARWTDVEQHLSAKDAQIVQLRQTMTELRQSLAERTAGEQRAAAQLSDRQAEHQRLLDERQRDAREAAARSTEVAAALATARAARDEAEALREQLAVAAAAGAADNEAPSLREELAALRAYVTNRHAWWNDLESRAAQVAARVIALERELAASTARHRAAESLAERETARATGLRSELVEHARLVEALRRELAAMRAAPRRPSMPPGSALTDLATAHGAAAPIALGTGHQADALPDTAIAARRTSQVAPDPAAKAPFGDEQALPGAAATETPPAPAFEVIAQLEAEVEHKRQQVTAQLVELRDRDKRLEAVERQLEAGRTEAAAHRAEVERLGADTVRLEQTLIDKDRALEARDARIATLQEELTQRPGTLQKLNAMDVSLQGLDSKMSERLRRAPGPAAADHNNTPVLVCLTGDAPKQLTLTKKAFIIGRGSHCDVQILTHFVSREHARITVIGDSALIEDLGSTNGVFVNSIRIDRHQLHHGDLITVGETQFRFLESVAH